MDLMDEIFRDAQRKGEFSNLPGEGKPLKLDDDSHIPAHLRVAHKLLKDNDLAPEWIEQGRYLERQQTKLVDGLKNAADSYQRALTDASRSSEPEQARQRAGRVWLAALAVLRSQISQYNSEILTYNLKVPRGVSHKNTFNLEMEMARLNIRQD